MDLHPQMELRIENAYYKDGMSRKGLNGFLGTETARFIVQPGGELGLMSVNAMNDRPGGQPGVAQLMSGPQARFRFHRFYFEILFTRRTRTQGSVLLGADTPAEISRLASQLADPETVCNEQSKNCTVFPEACSVSVEMQVAVNGTLLDILWGSVLASVAEHPRHLELRRLYHGRLLPVRIHSFNAEALRLPLLPGDRIEWD